MSLNQQFKTILWKNLKIFRKKFSIFSVCFELFFTFLIIATLCKFLKFIHFKLKNISFSFNNLIDIYIYLYMNIILFIYINYYI